MYNHPWENLATKQYQIQIFNQPFIFMATHWNFFLMIWYFLYIFLSQSTIETIQNHFSCVFFFSISHFGEILPEQRRLLQFLSKVGLA